MKQENVVARPFDDQRHLEATLYIDYKGKHLLDWQSVLNKFQAQTI